MEWVWSPAKDQEMEEAEVEEPECVDAVPVEESESIIPQVEVAVSARTVDPSTWETLPCNLPEDFCLQHPIATPCRGSHERPMTVEEIDMKLQELQFRDRILWNSFSFTCFLLFAQLAGLRRRLELVGQKDAEDVSCPDSCELRYVQAKPSLPPAFREPVLIDVEAGF